MDSEETPHPDPEPPTRRVDPGTFRLSDIDPGDTESAADKKDVKDELKDLRKRTRDLQSRLYAEHQRALLVVLQAMDTGGKDGTIKHVFTGINPQGCRVASFKVPSAEERDHDFLWRYHQQVPGAGMIGIFNRSHYEDVLVVRVKGLEPESVWRPRYDIINGFEAQLQAAGITTLKFYLHISRAEQKRRLQKRLDRPDKRWKFSSADLAERGRWDSYQVAFDEALRRTSTEIAPWYVVPADHKWYRNLVVARALVSTLEQMDPQIPDAERGLDDVEIPD